jgi:hypothetical protein
LICPRNPGVRVASSPWLGRSALFTTESAEGAEPGKEGVRIIAEIEEAQPEILVLLGDKPIKDFLRAFDRRWKRLSNFGTKTEDGRLHDVNLGSRRLKLLPLAHPRQASGLGTHSSAWRSLHAAWAATTAGGLLQ